MSKPILLLDFDGVINVFPEDKVLRRGGVGRVDWMKPDDPRRTLYSDGTAFRLDGNKRLRLDNGTWRVHWSSDLVETIGSLPVERYWLSTWQPYLDDVVDPLLGWTPDAITTIHWYDPATDRRPNGGKLAVARRISRLERRPLIWIDDEACDWDAQTILESDLLPCPVLMVQPDERIGISRRQLALVERFVADPGSFGPVSYDYESSLTAHSGHHGM